MLASMYIRTFGRLALEGCDFGRQKPLLVLVYLALEGPLPRRRLAELFWWDAADPRDSLTTTLRRLRGLGPGVIEGDGQRVWTALRCDAAELTRFARSGQLTEARELYRGPFLDSLAVTVHSEIEEWLYATRERLTGIRRHLGLQLARQLLLAGDSDGAGQEAEAVLDLQYAPVWHSGALHELEEILQRSSSVRLPELAELRAEAADTDTGMAGEFPAIATVFIGRTPELRLLQDRLSTGQARFVTLHGPGGIGKTRLAVEAARNLRLLPKFSDGVFYVPLETVRDRDSMAVALTKATGLPLPLETDPETHLLRNLADRKLLLVLDNAEHLTDHADFLANLLRTCRDLHMIVTSRKTFRLGAEFVLELAGLPPDPDALLLLRERMLARGRALGHDKSADRLARELCRLVDGSPLAIELAAGQVESRSLAELVQQLEAGLDVLTNNDPTAPMRHRSLSAALEVSWSTLSSEDSLALARCSVFSGGFDASAAWAIGISDTSLGNLVRATHLRRDAHGRYSMHPQVQQEAATRLGRLKDVEQAALRDHGRYYLRLVADRDQESLGGPEAADFVQRVSRDLTNIHGAWNLAVRLGWWEDLARVAPALTLYTETRGNYAEVYQLMMQACNALRPVVDRDGAQLHLAGLTGSLGYATFRLGRFEESLNLHQETEQLLSRHGPAPLTLWSARQGAALTLLSLQRVHEARQLAEVNVAGNVSAGNSPRDRLIWEVTTGTALFVRAFANYLLGEFQEGLSDIRQGFDLQEKHRGPHLGYSYWLLGKLLQAVGDPVQAQYFLEEGVKHVQATGFRNQIGYMHLELARIHLAGGRLRQAQGELELALARAMESADRWLELDSLALAGIVTHRSGDSSLARKRLLASMMITRERGSYGQGMDAVLGLAELQLESGQLPDAVRLLAFVARSRLAPAIPSQAAETRLAQLAEQTADRESFELALAQGAKLSPDQVFQVVPSLTLKNEHTAIVVVPDE